MKDEFDIIDSISDKLSSNERKLLAVVILTCYWGDSEYSFLDVNEKNEYPADIYTLDDIEENVALYKNVNLTSKQISGTFSSMFKKTLSKWNRRIYLT